MTSNVEVYYSDVDSAWRFQVEDVRSRCYDAMYKAVTAGRAEARARGVEVLVRTPDRLQNLGVTEAGSQRPDQLRGRGSDARKLTGAVEPPPQSPGI